MISLEKDSNSYQRAKFNKPYACIDIQNTSASSYIADFSATGKDIFWLDYDNPKEMGQSFADFVSILNSLNAESIVRITLNASPASLDRCGTYGKTENEIRKERLEEFKSRIPAEYLPTAMSEENLKSSNYPLLLLNCLDRAAEKALGTSPFLNKKIKHLFSTLYSDGQQMITLTSILLDKQEDLSKIHDLLDPRIFKHRWNEPIEINVPALTLKEILAINQHIPGTHAKEHISNEFNYLNFEKQIENYLRFYPYYPNFHHFNL